nr:NADH dehydrogenase subunit 2 [[Candida] subhashii]
MLLVSTVTYLLKQRHRLSTLRLLTLCLVFIGLEQTLSNGGHEPHLSLYLDTLEVSQGNLILILTVLGLSCLWLQMDQRDEIPHTELIIAATVLGSCLMIMSKNLLALYVLVELQSYGLYILTTIHNRSYDSTRAGLVYFIIGGLGSIVLLLGIYVLYRDTGSLEVQEHTLLEAYGSPTMGYWLIIIAFMIKMGLAPFHQWSIAVYNYAPTHITAYISVIAKVTLVGWTYNHLGNIPTSALVLVYYLSLLVGALRPLYTINLKVILAYSGVLNFGYLMLSVLTGDPSFYAYLVQYIITHVLIFTIILAAGRYVTARSHWSPLLLLEQLVLPNKGLALCFIVSIFSLIGIPPLAGFYAKYLILTTAMWDNYVMEALLLVVTSGVATYYYATIIKRLALGLVQRRTSTVGLEGGVAYIISTLTLMVLCCSAYLPWLSEGLILLST